MPLPPGPRRSAFAQTVSWALRPLPFLDDCARRFGDLFTMRLLGLGNIVCTSRPSLIKQVFTADANQLRAGEANVVLEPIVGTRSVLLLDGADHLRERRLLLPPFHGERMHAYANTMREVTEASLARWPSGTPFSLHPRFQQITLDIILRTVFGIDEGAQMSRFAALCVEFFTPPPALMAFIPQFRVDLPGSPYRRFLASRAAVDAEIFALITRRRAAGERFRGSDILSMLLAARDEDGRPMNDQELRDELVTMIVAGHETTATSLSWAFERILSEPRVLGRLAIELDEVVGDGPVTPELLGRLEYVDAVVKETLRLRPVLPIVARKVISPYLFEDFEVPAGTMIAPCIYLTHLRPDLYPEPERFLPERFLGVKSDPYSYLPFGGGSRRCIGMAFALYEIKMVLATVLARARLRLAPGAEVRVVRRAITLAPSGGTRVVLDRRGRRRSLPGKPVPVSGELD